MQHFVTIASFENQQSAERFHDWLEEGNFTSEVINPEHIEKIPLLGDSRIKYKVRVAREQAEPAHRILAMGAARLPGLILCPQCQSSRVEYPQLTRKSFGLFAIFAFLCRVGVMRPKFYCQDCQLTWSPDEPMAVGTRKARHA